MINYNLKKLDFKHSMCHPLMNLMLGKRLNLKGFVTVIFFLILTPVVLGTSLFSLAVLAEDTNQKTGAISYQGAKIFASLPLGNKSISPVLGISDARPEILRQYLEKYDSPLLPYIFEIIEISDKYNLDFRLTTAIAQQESNLCKKIPLNTYNCWGWGIHSRGTLGFSSYMEGLEAVSKGLMNEYINNGFVTPEEIMSKYTPFSNGSWAQGVLKFMEEME